jgi:hypothetical protein
MTLQRFVFKSHKWLAVGVGFFTFTWFFSGIVMALPGLSRAKLRPAAPAMSSGGADAPAPPEAQPFRQIAVTIPQAIAAAEGAAGRPLRIERVGLKTVAGKLLYELEAQGPETILIDTASGARIVIDESLARQIAQQRLGHPAEWEPVTVLRSYSRQYKFGPLPVYRFAARDPQRTIIFVSIADGEASGTTRMGRLKGAISQLHTFGIFVPSLSGFTATALLELFSVVGLVMTFFGGWILLYQFQSWRRARGRSA